MEWVRGDPVGHGSFGTVNLAIPKSFTPLISPFMAVKSCGASHSASLINEKLILDELRDCPETIRCFGGDFSSEGGEKLYNLLLEFASGGNLAEKVCNSGDRKLSEFDVQRYTKSILKGLRYIHQIGYVHCDIKLQNILLFSSGNGGDFAKIADFGLAKRAGEKIGSEVRGTPMYMSPETVTGGEQESPADIWALGCAVAEMVTGAPAWSCRPDSGVGGLLMRIGVGDEVPEIPGKMSEEGKDFLGKCFVKDPRRRWTAQMLLDHPFITVPLKETPSTSPRCHFDFPDWLSENSSLTCSMTSLSSPESDPWVQTGSPVNWPGTDSWSGSPEYSPADRLRQLVTGQLPNWSVTDSWVTVR